MGFDKLSLSGPRSVGFRKTPVILSLSKDDAQCPTVNTYAGRR